VTYGLYDFLGPLEKQFSIPETDGLLDLQLVGEALGLPREASAHDLLRSDHVKAAYVRAATCFGLFSLLTRD
jgi:hypothetical protein